ncbi:L,D-transpeptidase [Kaistia algarum]|uniref:L,D-transpeptidase n=1 Tax=Kaistia algarum TaxID=2083279 RepID=UPI002253297A|nr:L,D-transpeptidase [Kaistia algarum]MCX5512477.1 L,D-transpeptidase [Kaistia algarum]
MKIGRVLSGMLLAAAMTMPSQHANAENFLKLLFQGNGDFQPSGPGVSLQSKYQRQRVNYGTNEKPGTIVIDTDQKFLYLVEGNGKAMRYGVGVGREGFGWNGTVKIGRKAEWPTWTPPPEMRARERKKGRILPVSMEGGPQNPLGARAMYLYDGGRDTMFRIHGTSEPWTIGHNVSSGCIRMVNADVSDLYSRAPIGTKVIVR